MPVKTYSLAVEVCWFDATLEDVSQIMAMPAGLRWDVTVHHKGGLDPDYAKPVLILEKYFPPSKPVIVNGYSFEGPALAQYLFQGRTLYGQEMTQFAGYAVKSPTICARKENQLFHCFKFVEAVPRKRFGLFMPRTSKPRYMEEQDFREIFEKPCIEYHERISRRPEYLSQAEDAAKYDILKERIAKAFSKEEQLDRDFLRTLRISSD